ncbi:MULTISPECIES: carbohydrate ABC transporter permease [unclassified Mesorhizobium]|uniref:carbohydrate ABC transporter permease n=2 Tax=Mesorhizobium TaxID=68287 RepID=UPI00109290EE|nr:MULTISPECIES: carbohydrate ABC transporter permease [unclassified Mesorhizobium]TGP87899.1 carbohydrate ABC transporter permease [Mesorhizobium sp. M8A.F.Ca.ET.218.01.1.1]TGT15697.1 carbohydrate ABC transporter permease [Mesorhizobium sp. M8A.F.Ca.ET.213.01.1.1]
MNEGRLLRWVAFLACLVWALFVAAPFWWVGVTAFKAPTDVNGGPTYLPWIDFNPTFSTFREIVAGERGDFFRGFWHSTAVGLSATALAVFFGSMAAYGLSRFEYRIKLAAAIAFAAIAIGGFILLNEVWRLPAPQSLSLSMLAALPTCIVLNRLRLPGPQLGNKDITFWFVSQRMFPPVVSAFALFLFYAELNKQGVRLLDSYLGLVLAYTAFGLPLAVWLMIDFFKSVPLEVEEAALVDDVPRWRIFFEIVLPMVRPGMLATFMIVLAFIWNEFLFALLLTTSRWQTLPVVLAGQVSSRGDEWWAISAATLISIVPMMFVAALLGRMMRSGLLAGSIK